MSKVNVEKQIAQEASCMQLIKEICVKLKISLLDPDKEAPNNRRSVKTLRTLILDELDSRAPKDASVTGVKRERDATQDTSFGPAAKAQVVLPPVPVLTVLQQAEKDGRVHAGVIVRSKVRDDDHQLFRFMTFYDDDGPTMLDEPPSHYGFTKGRVFRAPEDNVDYVVLGFVNKNARFKIRRLRLSVFLDDSLSTRQKMIAANRQVCYDPLFCCKVVAPAQWKDLKVKSVREFFDWFAYGGQPRRILAKLWRDDNPKKKQWRKVEVLGIFKHAKKFPVELRIVKTNKKVYLEQDQSLYKITEEEETERKNTVEVVD